MPFLKVEEFEVVPADSGSKMLGPGIYAPGGHRIGQLILTIDEDTAKELREALDEEYGVWDKELQKRVKPNASPGKAHRR